MDLFEIHHIKNIPVIVLREDRRYAAPLPHHMKMGALEQVCIEVKEDGYKTIGCFCTTHGIWPFGLPWLADKHGLNSIICFPSKKIERIPHQLLPENFEDFKTNRSEEHTSELQSQSNFVCRLLLE